MRNKSDAKKERLRRKAIGTKYPFDLLYYFFCDECRTALYCQAHDKPRPWVDIWENLAPRRNGGCTCRTFLQRAEINLKSFRRINFKSAHWRPKNGVEKLEKYRDSLILKANRVAGSSYEEVARKIQDDRAHGSFADAPLSGDIADDYPEQHLLLTWLYHHALTTQKLKTTLYSIPSISAGQGILTESTNSISHLNPRDYLTPFCWTYAELNRSRNR